MSWLNTILILTLAYVAAFLEGSFDGFRNLIGAQITLLPALMVYASMTSEIGTVALLAVCGGLWRDSLSKDPLGASILPLMLIGYLIMWKRELLLRESQIAQMVLGLAAGAVFPLATLFLLLNLRREPLLGWGLVWQWVVGALTGGMLAPLLFAVFNRLRRAIEYPAQKQSSFRDDREIKRGRQ
jgi:cell shape-determining protein MreD